MNSMTEKIKSDQQSTLEKRLADLERRLDEVEKLIGRHNQPGRARGASRKKLSLKEFINDKAPKNIRQTTLAVAFYIENDGVIPFNVLDLEQGFRAGKIPPPKNINDMVNKNVAAGLLMEVAERKNGMKAWELTATGEEVVGRGFSKE